VKKPVIRVWRVCCLTLLFSSLSFLALTAVQHSRWYKERMFQSLLEGNSRQRLAAASSLARVGAEDYLLRGLKSSDSEARELARRALEQLWFTAAGSKAYQRILEANEAVEKKKYTQALEILDEVVAAYPQFAEGWNRRASVYWEMGEYQKSMADCERALKLNPNHYGAWQGLGVCQLQLGEVEAACRSLRAALKILPYDEATRASLQQCEDLLRTYPPPGVKPRDYDLI
jgi:tetratricopeptide (TPR) repeat protein